jgi:dihydroneopterin aldolase
MTSMSHGRLTDTGSGLRHVFLRDILLPARIGVHAHEQGAPQRVRINVDLAVEDDGARRTSRAPVGRDDLDRVVDYEAVANLVRRIVGHDHVNLVETLAERLAEACLLDPRVCIARIRVEKLDVFPDIGSAGVEVERRRL